MASFTQTTDSLGVSALSIAVVSPDEQSRKAAMDALSECQPGRVREFKSYPADLNDVPAMLGNDFDVVIVDEVVVDVVDADILA